MTSSGRRHLTGLALAFAVVAVALSPPVQSLVHCPREIRLLLGEEQRLSLLGLPVPAVVRADRDGLLRINDQEAEGGGWRVNLSSPLALSPVGAGRCRLDLSLFGLLTLRSVAVEVVSRPSVTPGGQSIGILVRTAGVTVVGYAPVDGSDGDAHYPARDAGVEVGDTILKVDGTEAQSSQHVVFLVNRCAREGRSVPLEIERSGGVVRVEVPAIYSLKERIFQLGLYVRDGAAGVGTLTFYDPASRVFMALGHVISDATTNQPLEVSDGRVVRASVASVRPGRRGDPGEKEGTFVEGRGVIGSITGNTEFGLVGYITGLDQLGEESPEDATAQPEGSAVPAVAIPVALAREVKVGPAEIRTVVEGSRVRTFACEITRVDASQTEPAPKGITLRITDPALLEATGGIIQGMSGSPIIQNGRLVGAVTHVFVNDPTRGYGVFAEWMLWEAGLLQTGAGQVSCPAAAS